MGGDRMCFITFLAHTYTYTRTRTQTRTHTRTQTYTLTRGRPHCCISSPSFEVVLTVVFFYPNRQGRFICIIHLLQSNLSLSFTSAFCPLFHRCFRTDFFNISLFCPATMSVLRKLSIE